MRGKGGPENMSCKYRGVRQRTWGKWVSEISYPNRGDRIWIGTFDDSKAAALAYDEAAIRIYGATAKLNFPDQMSFSVHSTASTSSHTIIEQDAIVNDMPSFLEKLIEMQQGEHPPGDEVSLIANPFACLINDHVYDYHDQSVLHERLRSVAPAVDQGQASNVMKNDESQKAKHDDDKEKMKVELPESDDSSTDFSKINDLGVAKAGISEYAGNDDWEGDLGSINFWLDSASYTLA